MSKSSRLHIIVERIDVLGRVRREATVEDWRGLPAHHSSLAELRDAIRYMYFVMCQLSAHVRTPPCITEILTEDGVNLVAAPDAYDRLPRDSHLRVRVMVHTHFAHAWNLVRPLLQSAYL